MKRGLSIVLAALFCMSMTVFGSESDLEARIAALEERVAALEAQIGAPPEGVTAAEAREPGEIGDVETGMIAGGCSLSFKRAEVAKDGSGNDVVIMYFDFTNESGENQSASSAFYVKIFQHDREMDSATISNNSAFDDKFTQFRSGAAPVEVAYVSQIADMSDIIVNISSFIDWNAKDVEFNLSLE